MLLGKFHRFTAELHIPSNCYGINSVAGAGMAIENALSLKLAWPTPKKKSPPPVTARGRGLRMEIAVNYCTVTAAPSVSPLISGL